MTDTAQQLYAPNAGILYTLNDACFLIKASTPVSYSGTYGGVMDSTHTHLAATGYNSINGNNYANSFDSYGGYIGLSRYSSTNFLYFRNTGIDCTDNVTGLSSGSLIVLSNNNNEFLGSGNKVELYAMGKSITWERYVTFQTIMNTYFASF